MKKDHENIEEKLVPYLEGVLNPKERREVDEAINSDGELAREMSELREVILQLRQGFASGLRPPQEEVSVDEVVELGATTGSVDKLPGTSQQKARLFCSDQALEEYSMLRALQEEMARTTLDRENVPEMPEALLKEFRAIKSSAPSTGKVLAFDKRKLSPAPLWKRASSTLDRIDPKPLMASAAALVMLSLGVHMYNRSPAPMTTDAEKQIGYNFSDAPSAPPSAATASASPAAAPRLAGQESGVAVFTSDDRGLLKQQAEKLMAGKVRYTVTKDRILVAEKDVKMARDILWADEDGKAVAIAAKESPSDAALAQPKASAGMGAARPAPAPSESAYSGAGQVDQSSSQPEAPVVDDAAIEAVARGGASEVTLYRSEPARAPVRPSAPARPKAPAPSAARKDEGSRAASAAYSAPRRQAQSAPEAAPPAPTDVRLERPPLPSTAPMGMSAGTDPGVLNSEAKPRTTSPERRARLQKLALEGAERDDAAGDDPPTPTQVQTTLERARVAAAPPSVSASAPVPNVVTADTAGDEDSEEDRAEGRLTRMETSRQKVAQRHGVELSFESKSGKVAVYVRPKKSLTKAELDALRKTLRKELGLADSDTIIFR